MFAILTKKVAYFFLNLNFFVCFWSKIRDLDPDPNQNAPEIEIETLGHGIG
jgi:hypothetical protein